MVLTLILGVLCAVGLVLLIFAGQLNRKLAEISRRSAAERAETKRLKAARASARKPGRRISAVGIVQIVASVLGGLVGWSATDLMGMALLLGGMGALLPPFMAAPRRRRRQMREALAWALWSRQLAELARSGSGLVEAIRGSAEHVPRELEDIVEKVASSAELHGLGIAMDELAEAGKVWEPEIAAGLRMAATAGGAIADPLFDLCGRINDVVDLYRAKNEAIVELWTQTIALLSLAGGVVTLMYRNNPAYFDPYSSGTGQLVFLLISLMLLGATFYLVYHSVVREEYSILVMPKKRNRAKDPI